MGVQLSFNARKIASVERDLSGKPFLSFVRDIESFPMYALAVFVKHGMSLENEDKAYDLIEEHGFLQLVLATVSALDKAGFIRKGVEEEKVEESPKVAKEKK